jgi:hypothetical protein
MTNVAYIKLGLIGGVLKQWCREECTIVVEQDGLASRTNLAIASRRVQQVPDVSSAKEIVV